MTTLYKNEQSGRSMVEMLGVLAIIGVLSIGGISGYSKAMAKFRINKTMDQISMLVMNVRSLFSGSMDYTGLDNKMAVQLGIIPGEMIVGTNKTSGSKLINAYQGEVVVKTQNVGGSNRSFSIEYAGLSREGCIALATADWGSQAGSGLIGIAVSKGLEVGKAANPTASATGTITASKGTAYGVDNLPITLSTATTDCYTDEGKASITWFYY